MAPTSPQAAETGDARVDLRVPTRRLVERSGDSLPALRHARRGSNRVAATPVALGELPPR